MDKKQRNILLFVILISWAYWIYLLYHTTMVIKYDGAAYQQQAQALFDGGLEGYFQFRRSNVIFYPLVIVLAKKIALAANLDPFRVQAAIQLLFLFAAQILLYVLLKRLKMRFFLIVSTLLYLAFSPSLTNAALSSWSEVVAFPFVLGIILVGVSAFQAVKEGDVKKIILRGIVLGLLFAVATLGREVYEYVFFLYLFVGVILLINFLVRNQKRYFLHTLLLMAVVLIPFESLIVPYKYKNFQYYQEFSLVPLKGAECAYGSTISRAQKMTKEQVGSFIAFIPGENVVKKLYGEKMYHYWYFDIYGLGLDKIKELKAQGLTEQEISSEMYRLMVKAILHNPVQYTLLTIGSGAKMFFWESTQIGFVNYPEWLTKIYGTGSIKLTLRLVMSVLTFIGFFYGLWYLCRRTKSSEEGFFLFCILSFILFNIALYAPFIIDTRYGLPLAPLYLILINLWIETKILNAV